MSDTSTKQTVQSNPTGTSSSNSEANGMSHHAREAADRVSQSAVEFSRDAAQHYVREPAQDIFGLMKSYAKDNPDVAACWAFGIGVLVGWKLKP
ncbi:hypothetical protein LOC71_07085 [Rhodopirellula sp. JC740]|uniref:DUF883 domain-containing protein n=1 Tax=Rhodopirellula halodulae TaxID=2894198 RepID=A0ABS8NEQ2_9BACT|nr:hypothetical protein [Rhodopirellula sp. JC740]MCC9642034.1 hypothetical protein [Rhodopirellula sp. JC740]